MSEYKVIPALVQLVCKHHVCLFPSEKDIKTGKRKFKTKHTFYLKFPKKPQIQKLLFRWPENKFDFIGRGDGGVVLLSNKVGHADDQRGKVSERDNV